MTLTYRQARTLLLAGGCFVIAVIAAVMYARHVETVEIISVLLFLPIFGALLTWDVAGGTLAGLVASGCYVALRWSAIRAVGFGQFSGLVTSRVLGFLVFGAAGGWANRQLRTSLTKLVLYDQIDDATGLYNARFVVAEIDLELARSERYKTVFSVALVDIPDGWLEALPHRQRASVLRALGAMMVDAVRTVDRAAHSVGPDGHRLAVILPETAAAGANLFADRLAQQLTEWLRGQGVTGEGRPVASSVTYPGDEAGVAELRAVFERLDRLEHPPEAVLGGVASGDGR